MSGVSSDEKRHAKCNNVHRAASDCKRYTNCNSAHRALSDGKRHTKQCTPSVFQMCLKLHLRCM